ncbi:MAG: alanyl-tRNA editing protein [Halanaerobiales bacterium]
MTKKLYYTDSFLKKFTANIYSHYEENGEYHLRLDRTAFYPEGGGQPADKGYIGKSRVNYVYEDGGELYHVVDSLPKKKNNLECQIDWERRFDLMQQHTGQHLLSAVLEKLYRGQTVGFHLGENRVTIDTDVGLTREALHHIETEVNDIIYQNKMVQVEYPDSQELDNMDLRKEPDVEGNIRIIKIEGTDISPCGGTHLKTTGQIGIISVVESENYKGGTRISFLCGRRALLDYRFKNDITAEIRDVLSVKNEDIIPEMTRVREELADKEKKIEYLNDELLDYKINDYRNKAEKIKDYRIITKILTEENYNNTKIMANKLTDQENNIIIFGQKDSDTARIILAKSENIDKMNMNKLIKEVMQELDGNGGGHEYFAQGGFSKMEQLPAAVEKAYQRIKNSL